MMRVATIITESYTTERITHKRYKNISNRERLFSSLILYFQVLSLQMELKKGHQNVDVKMQTLVLFIYERLVVIRTTLKSFFRP